MKLTQEQQRQVDGVMAGAGCYQQADRTWWAKCGPFSSLNGFGNSREAAMRSLAKKVGKIIVYRDRKNHR